MCPSFCINKSIAIGGEQLAVGGELNSGHSFSENSFSEHDSPGKRICPCNTCRTVYLTSGNELTLLCHYCESGFLVRTKQSDDYSYQCIDCGTNLGKLPFIIRLCNELQDEIEYWRKDFESRDDPELALAQWDRFYHQLCGMMNQTNLKMINITTELAKAYTAPTGKQDYKRAIQLAQVALKALLQHYEMGSVLDSGTLADVIMPDIEQVANHANDGHRAEQEQVQVDKEAILSVLTDMQELKAKFDELQLKP